MIEIGERVVVNNDRGTVRYVGKIDGFDGEWIGIEWDNPERGKHNGSVKGKCYFVTQSAKGGSFVRPQSVMVGRNLLEELTDKYDELLLHKAKDFHHDKTQEVFSSQSIYVKSLSELRIIALDNMKVARAPPNDCSVFEFCIELNLHNNLLSRWCDLLDILSFFPRLKFLNASYNYMEKGMKTVNDKRKVTAPIHTLVLDNCRIDDSTAKRLLYVFPYVREIHLDRNDLTCFDFGEYGQNLEAIDLEGNPINNFDNLQALSTLPNLQDLNIVDCNLHQIRLPSPVGFSSLKSLNIKENPLELDCCLSELAKLPSLDKLSVTVKTKENLKSGIVRCIIIAKLPQLKVLENSEITKAERESAEHYFLSKFGVPPVAETHQADIERLSKQYDKAITTSLPDLSENDFVKLNLSYDGKILERSLPKSVTVQRLYSIVSRLFHLDSRKISLQYSDSNGYVIKLDNLLRDLQFYSLTNDSTISVNNI